MLPVKPSSPSANVEEYFPAAQSLQTEAEAPEYVPAAHLLQTEAEAAKYVPAAQEMQVVGAGISESSSAPSTSLLRGAMPGASNIAFLNSQSSCARPERAPIQR
jgi:hypothetical protein